MREFLADSGYDVVPEQNGIDAYHRVLAEDFEVIFSDLMMPTLPGDKFYRAVERTRPHLCGRFVFMTGHVNKQEVSEAPAEPMIDGVAGINHRLGGTLAIVLHKPFTVDDLLDVIAFTHTRRTTGEAEQWVPPPRMQQAAVIAAQRFAESQTPAPAPPPAEVPATSSKELRLPPPAELLSPPPALAVPAPALAELKTRYLGDDFGPRHETFYGDLTRIDLLSEIEPSEAWEFDVLAGVLDRRISPLLAHDQSPKVVLILPLSGEEYDFQQIQDALRDALPSGLRERLAHITLLLFGQRS